MRVRGATSNVAIRLDQLNAILRPDAIILIARRQASQLGLIGRTVKATDETIVASGNQPALQEKVSLTEVVEEPEHAMEQAPVQGCNCRMCDAARAAKGVM